MTKEYYVMELNGFQGEEEAQEFLSGVFAEVKWREKQNMTLSHLNEKGVKILREQILGLKEESLCPKK